MKVSEHLVEFKMKVWQYVNTVFSYIKKKKKLDTE